VTAYIEAMIMVLRVVAEVDPKSSVRVEAAPGQVILVRVGDVDTAAAVAARLGAGWRMRLDRVPRQHPQPPITVQALVEGEPSPRVIPMPATTAGSPLPTDITDRVAQLLACRRDEVTIIQASPGGCADVHVYPLVLCPPSAASAVTVEISAVEPDPVHRRRAGIPARIP
jgi:nitrogen fixation protein